MTDQTSLPTEQTVAIDAPIESEPPQREQSNWAIAIAITLGFMVFFAALGAWIVGSLDRAIVRPLPFEVSAPYYEATPSRVCPGDMIEYSIEVTVHGPTTVPSARTWWDLAQQKTIGASLTGDLPVSTWLAYPDIAAYYSEHFGISVPELDYPLQINDTVRAEVPQEAPYDTAILLVSATVAETTQPITYAVPILTKTEAECAAE